MLAVPACGDSGSGSLDAATKSDGPATAWFDTAVPPHRDTAPGVDLGAQDVPADTRRDVPQFPDLAPPASLDTALDQPVGSFDGSGPVDTAVERGSADVALDATPRDATGAGDATPLDATVEAGPAFCALRPGVDAGVAQRRCYDFSDPASATDFVPEAGTWTVANGAYHVVAPDDQVTCPNGDGSLMTASVLANLSAKDVHVQAKLTAISSPDKVIVLRSRPNGNRIELNFRANFVFDDVAQGGDLHVSALVDCVPVVYVPIATVLIPHVLGQTIVADVRLIGQRLRVAVGGNVVFDGTLSLPTDPGAVGFAAFREAVTQFDDLLVEVLD